MHMGIFAKYYPYGYRHEFVSDEMAEKIREDDIPQTAIQDGYCRGYGTEMSLKRLPLPDIGEEIEFSGKWKVKGEVYAFTWANNHELPVIHFRITGGQDTSESPANPARLGRYGSAILWNGQPWESGLSEPSFYSKPVQSARIY